MTQLEEEKKPKLVGEEIIAILGPPQILVPQDVYAAREHANNWWTA